MANACSSAVKSNIVGTFALNNNCTYKYTILWPQYEWGDSMAKEERFEMRLNKEEKKRLKEKAEKEKTSSADWLRKKIKE